MQTEELAVFIGRFSPPHLGHFDVISKALRSKKRLLILIGSSDQSRTIKNPFTFSERKSMILDWFTQSEFKDHPEKLVIDSLRDYPYSDVEWITEVQTKVDAHKKDFESTFSCSASVSVTGSDRDSSTWYLKAFPAWGLQLLDPETDEHDFQLSATSVREILFSRTDSNPGRLIAGAVPDTTLAFLKKFTKTSEFKNLCDEFAFIKKYKDSWKAAPYAPTFVTVDNVVVHSGHILLVKRRAAPGKGLWALPGGFLEQNERTLAGALRELSEETKINLARAQIEGAVKDKEIFDDPDRSLRGRTITIAYLTVFKKTGGLPKVKGADDADKAKWIPISEALSDPSIWFEDHYHIAKTMIARIKD